MKNKDTILLENAYQSVYNESEYTIDNRDPFTSDLTTAEGVTISVDIWELVENAVENAGLEPEVEQQVFSYIEAIKQALS